MTNQNDNDKLLADLRKSRAETAQRLADVEAAIEKRKQSGEPPCPSCEGEGAVWVDDDLGPCPDCMPNGVAVLMFGGHVIGIATTIEWGDEDDDSDKPSDDEGSS